MLVAVSFGPYLEPLYVTAGGEPWSGDGQEHPRFNKTPLAAFPSECEGNTRSVQTDKTGAVGANRSIHLASGILIFRSRVFS